MKVVINGHIERKAHQVVWLGNADFALGGTYVWIAGPHANSAEWRFAHSAQSRTTPAEIL